MNAFLDLLVTTDLAANEQKDDPATSWNIFFLNQTKQSLHKEPKGSDSIFNITRLFRFLDYWPGGRQEN